MQSKMVKDTVRGERVAADDLPPITEGRAPYERFATIRSFDNTDEVPAVLSRPERYKQLFAALSAPNVISRGGGLSYCLATAANQGRSILATQFNRFLAFDEESGVVRLEPGVTLGALFEFAIARNLLPPVLPGYPLITVGGAVGMNIHGKNQFQVGNFGDQVKRIALYHPRWGEVSCSPTENPDLFRLTIGGFGLTGHITSVDVALRSLPGKCLVVERHNVSDLVEGGFLMEKLSDTSDYTYSWHNLNLRGRRFGSGTVYEEHHTDEGATPTRTGAPITIKPLPFSLYNRLTVPLLCSAYQMKERVASRTMRSDLYGASFPLIGKEMYFRMYGKRGFREYQALFPRERWEEVCKRVARAIEQAGTLILLASIKTFRGERSLLNFSGNGICLSVDTPNTPAAGSLFARLDEMTIELGGIGNISKDSRLSAKTIHAMYGAHYEEFRSALRNYDPEQHFQSELRRRIDV